MCYASVVVLVVVFCCCLLRKLNRIVALIRRINNALGWFFPPNKF